MPPSRVSRHSDAVRINVVLSGICPQPTDCGFTIMNLSRPDRFTRQSISDRDPYVLTRHHQRTDCSKSAPLISPLPAPTMNEDDNGKRLIALGSLGHIKIQSLSRIVCARIGDIEFRFDRIRYSLRLTRTCDLTLNERAIFFCSDDPILVGIDLIKQRP